MGGSPSRAIHTFEIDSATFAIGLAVDNNFKISRGLDVNTPTDIALVITQTDGFVGIGTASPSSALHVRKDQNDVTSVIVENGAGTAPGSARVLIKSTGSAAYIGYEASSSVWSSGVDTDGDFKTKFGSSKLGGGTQALIITQTDGFVGIGTTFTPLSALHVRKDQTSVTSIRVANAAASSTASARVYIQSSEGAAYIGYEANDPSPSSAKWSSGVDIDGNYKTMYGSTELDAAGTVAIKIDQDGFVKVRAHSRLHLVARVDPSPAQFIPGNVGPTTIDFQQTVVSPPSAIWNANVYTVDQKGIYSVSFYLDVPSLFCAPPMAPTPPPCDRWDVILTLCKPVQNQQWSSGPVPLPVRFSGIVVCDKGEQIVAGMSHTSTNAQPVTAGQLSVVDRPIVDLRNESIDFIRQVLYLDDRR
jgi:hypothetical protein